MLHHTEHNEDLRMDGMAIQSVERCRYSGDRLEIESIVWLVIRAQNELDRLGRSDWYQP